MELKQSFIVGLFIQRETLLIVPYGIETESVRVGKQMYQLLIVPYGIETRCFS